MHFLHRNTDMMNNEYVPKAKFMNTTYKFILAALLVS